MITSRAKKLVTPMAHQKVSLAHDKKNPSVFDMSDPGCVSADTEYLTPVGWKRIDRYVEGDLVAQFHPTSREIEFVEPTAYVKRPCKTMIAIAPTRGTSQRLSHEHRVLYYKPDGSHDVCSAEEFMKGLHRHGPNHFRRKFCTTFSVRHARSIPLTNLQLRVMVAVIADGHFQNGSNRCVIRIKKERKVVRLRYILAAAGINWDEKNCGGADKAFRVFTFEAPRNEKHFGPDWWNASQNQLEVISDELQYWDSAISPNDARGVRFSSFVEASANFAQYAFAASKRPASLTCSVRDRTHEDRGVMVEFCVHAQNDNKLIGPGRRESVFEISNPEGFKYCFEVPTSFLLLRHNGFIFATGNTGKTAVRIWSFAERRRKRGGCLLVLAPRSLLRTAWGNDFTKFAPDMKVSVATAANRVEAFSVDADAYITNHDAVKVLAKQPKAWFKKFDELVIDESTAYKHHTSQRSRAIAKIAGYFKRRACLSATPTSNGICDIWHQAYLLDQGKRLGPNFFGFRSTVCIPKQVGRSSQAVSWSDKPGAEEAVFGLLSEIVVRHRFEDCVDIPATHTYTVDYVLEPKQRKAYDTMERDQLLELSKLKSVSAINAAAVTTKLLQIASGAVYDAAGKYHVVDRGRYETLIEMAAARHHPLMLFFWQHQRDLLAEEAEARGLAFGIFDGALSDTERAQMVNDYQQGKFDLLLGHPQTVAHGLTLTRGTSVIWSGPTYNLEWWKQANKRQARIGQTAKTEVVTLLAPGTIEEKVYDMCMGKNARMGNLLDLFESLSMPTATKVARAMVTA